MKKLKLLAMFCLFSTLSSAESLKVLTFNVAQLSPYKNNSRLELLCSILERRLKQGDALDIIFIQEAWFPWAKQKLTTCGYNIYDPDHDSPWWMTSGLLIMTPHHIMRKSEKRISYNQFLDEYFYVGGEFLVNKMVAGIKIFVKNKLVWAVNSHLTAKYNRIKYWTERINQVNAVSWLAKQFYYDTKQNVIIGADFNTGPNVKGPIPAWKQLKFNLSWFNFAKLPITSSTATEGHIDHIISTMKVLKTKKMFDKKYILDGRKQFMSDHAGVEAELEF